MRNGTENYFQLHLKGLLVYFALNLDAIVFPFSILFFVLFRKIVSQLIFLSIFSFHFNELTCSGRWKWVQMIFGIATLKNSEWNLSKFTDKILHILRHFQRVSELLFTNFSLKLLNENGIKSQHRTIFHFYNQRFEKRLFRLFSIKNLIWLFL